MKRDISTFNSFGASNIGPHATGGFSFAAGTRARRAKIPRLRRPALLCGKRPKLSLSRKTDP